MEENKVLGAIREMLLGEVYTELEGIKQEIETLHQKKSHPSFIRRGIDVAIALIFSVFTNLSLPDLLHLISTIATFLHKR